MKNILQLSLAAVSLIVFFVFVPIKVDAALFTLDPQSRTVAPGELFSVDVKIDTQNEAATSADVLLDFNAAILEPSAIIPGSFFPQNFKTTSASQIYIGGSVQNATETRIGAGILATINFKAVGIGTANVSFDCNPGQTADSNITKDDRNASDILVCTQLVNGLYTVAGTVTTAPGQPTIALTPGVPTPTPKTLPPAGNFENTLILGGIGIILTIIGIMSML